MSDLVFPSTLSGFTWDCKKKPTFNNLTHSPISGRDIHISLWSQPVYEFTLTNEFLTSADKSTLINFFINRRGSFDSFLYADEDCYGDVQFFTADGIANSAQIVNPRASYNEQINNLIGTTIIYMNDVALTHGSDYTISATGLVTFTFVPTAGSVFIAKGGAYYRCVFRRRPGV